MLFVPSIWFPFSSFSSFLSCPSVFTFCHLILSFGCARIGPGLSVYVRIHTRLKLRFQVAQVLTMRWGSSVVPVHLVPLSSQLRTFLSCPVFSSCLHLFVFAACARAHCPYLSSFSRLLSGRCVCVPLVVTGILFELFLSRGVRRDCGTALNEATAIMEYRV